VLLNFVTPDAGIPSVEYPAASPYVVAVGGTSLFTDAGFNYATETAWDAGGGGTSLFETAPAWQAAVAPIAAVGGLRAVPDMAMESGGPDVGLPELGFVGVGGAAIIYNGQPGQVVGTSLASPLAVGAWTRIQSAHCNALGFAAPLLYALDRAPAIASSTAAGFHDVTVGSNGLYVATPGWDYTTGYGSFDISSVNAALPPAPAGCTPAP
jgi:subtilase family serine protease